MHVSGISHVGTLKNHMGSTCLQAFECLREGDSSDKTRREKRETLQFYTNCNALNEHCAPHCCGASDRARPTRIFRSLSACRYSPGRGVRHHTDIGTVSMQLPNIEHWCFFNARAASVAGGNTGSLEREQEHFYPFEWTPHRYCLPSGVPAHRGPGRRVCCRVRRFAIKMLYRIRDLCRPSLAPDI